MLYYRFGLLDFSVQVHRQFKFSSDIDLYRIKIEDQG